MTTKLIQANYSDPAHGRDLLYLLDIYARDPMGGGEPISEGVKAVLIAELAARPYAFSVLAYVEGKPAGLANCFEGFSTFKAKPLANIHDLVVHSDYRGQKLSTALLAKVEEIARDKGACKITLEVLSGNTSAKASYKKFGFIDYELDPESGTALFWEKPL